MNEERKKFNSTIRRSYLKDNNVCRCEKCNREKSTSSLEVHHKIPLADGGTNDYINLIALCKRCHDEWHNVEGIDGITFEEWLKIPPYFVLIYMFKSINKNIDTKEKQEVMGIRKDVIKSFFDLGFDTYKIQQQRKYEENKGQ